MIFKPKYSLAVKLTVFLVSLFFSLLILEVGLRLFALQYQKKNIYGVSGAKRTILCIGDSFTWGGEVDRKKGEKPYPGMLGDLLVENKNGYRVINMGLCEHNSSQVLKLLPSWIKEYRPEIVLVMVGAANRFNPWGFESSMSGSLTAKLQDWWLGLKVGKLLRWIALSIQSKHLYWSTEEFFKYEINATLDPFNDYSLAEYVKADSPHLSMDLSVLKTQGERSLFFRRSGDRALERGDYGEAMQFFLEGIKADPTDYEHYYKMSKVFDFQSRFTARHVLNVFQQIEKERPSAKKLEILLSYHKLFYEKEKGEKRVVTWLERDLYKIIQLVRSNGAMSILMNYPMHYDMANTALEKVAREQGVSFINNTVEFDRLIAQGDKKQYLRDDEHCTTLGHQVLAQNVYRFFKEKGIFHEAR